MVISERLVEALWPIGHIVSFAFWAWLLLSFNAYIKSRGSKQQLFLLLLLTLIIGGGIELLQPFFSRSAQLGDLYSDLFGAFFAYLFFGNFNKNNNNFLIASRFLYIILLLYLMFPAMQTVKDEFETRIDFPIIAKFDSSSELTRWKADLPLSIVNSSELPVTRKSDTNLMKITFAAEKDSRAVLRFFAGNWQGYKQIKFSFFNPNQELLKVRLIITDQNYDKSTSENHTSNQNDRFGKWLLIDPGWNEYFVDLTDIENAPTERDMDLSNIAGVDFYMYKLKEPIILYVDNIELISPLD
ncbi:MAG: putative membrane protein YwzB [Psychromonas sp.]